ncbi:MAG: transcription termination/antitermination protein NusA, partial [Bacilli bacterium]
KELNGEKIDIIRYNKELEVFIANALSPAQDLKIIVTDVKKQEALVVASGDNLSLAIGRKGQNVRLAARLTHFKIDIKSHEEAAEMGIVFKEE